MLSREQIEVIISRVTDLSPEERKKLGRDLHVAISTDLVLERDDEFIKKVVDSAKVKLQKSKDVVALCNQFLNHSRTIPYIDQKIIQWMVAEAYSAGLKKSRRDIN